MPVEPEEKKDVPPPETRCQGQPPPPTGGGSDDASVSEEGPQELSKSPPDSSSTSSSPESDLDLGGHCRNKELRLRLSPESVISAKRCLWDVDRKEVDENLSREFKRIRQEESVKSIKWNYDFEKDVPIKGPWHWEEAEEPPDFYKPKIYPSKKVSQIRASPYTKPPKRKSLEAVSSSVGSTSSSSSDMAASSSSSSTSSAPSLSSYLVSTSIELSVLASNVSSTSSTTKDCEKPSSPVQVASESSEIFEGKEKSSKDSLSLVVASSSVDSSSSSSSSSSFSGEDRRMTLPSSKTSNVRQGNVKLELISVPEEVSKLEDTPILSTSCTSPASICGMVNVSSSDSSKTSISRDSSSSSNGNNNNSNRNNSDQNVSDVKNISSSSSSSTSGTTPGIVPSQFYSVESADHGSEGSTSSSCTSTEPSPKTTKEKGKVPPRGKPPKPPNSGESSSSHLLKYYR